MRKSNLDWHFCVSMILLKINMGYVGARLEMSGIEERSEICLCTCDSFCHNMRKVRNCRSNI